ncbi:CheR family methyltransferase [Thiocystis violacea]|uniref:CheR family methyltransferase n=1 Tax=Thiocystis violacea TaxID=13725 RepID=UPI0019084438|nr:protein-glutamate O-methyltransferase CheR [Thiocystis violacea]
MNLQSVQSFIKEHLGLHFGEQADAPWRRLLANRIASVGADSADAYLARLRTDEAELHALTSLLTINETYFYREPQHLKLLTERLCPELLARKPPDRPIRILSVGCSSGEEPYSILMALRERYGELADSLFDLSAGDVDREALERARAGVYNEFSFRALAPALIERYFTAVEGRRRRIDAGLRRRVTFHPLNLLAAEYPAVLRGQDLVFFRNVSIYFDAPTRERVLGRLKSLLNPGGYLIVGISETLANDVGILTLRELDGAFFFADVIPERPVHTPAFSAGPGSSARPALGLDATMRPRPASEADPALLGGGPLHGEPERRESAVEPRQRMREQGLGEQPLIAPPTAEPSKLLAPESVERRYQEALALTRAERFDDALARLAPLCASASPRIQDLTLQAHLLLEGDDAAGASAAVARALAIDPWCLDALLLSGRIAQGQGDAAGAIGHLRRAIYHRSDAWQAHFQLAELYREGGHWDQARREYRIVLRQLERPDRSRPDPPSGEPGARVADSARDHSPLPFPYALRDLRLLCQTRLSRLDATPG